MLVGSWDGIHEVWLTSICVSRTFQLAEEALDFRESLGYGLDQEMQKCLTV
jgi:hypothetical protein